LRMEHELTLRTHDAVLDQITNANSGSLGEPGALQNGGGGQQDQNDGSGQPQNGATRPTGGSGRASSPGQAGQQPQADEPPMTGARKAPDGKWYVKHPSGTFMRVDKAA
jgi:hypothetical protein